MRYIVTTNTPGYLPEDDDPFTTDDETTARQVLADMIERDWDGEYSCLDHSTPVDSECPECLSVDARYLDAHTSVNLISVPGSVYVPAPEWQAHGLGRVYSIDVAEHADDSAQATHGGKWEPRCACGWTTSARAYSAQGAASIVSQHIAEEN